MKLDRIDISNFKSLKQAHFEPGAFGCLVGENNAGKSSVMQAIVYALKRPVLPESLFYDPTLPVVFTLRFSGVTPAHLLRLEPEPRERIARHIREESLTLRIRSVPGEKAVVRVDERVPREIRFTEEGITAAIGGQRGLGLRNAMIQAYPELAEQMPEPLNMTAAKELLQQHIQRLPEEACELREAPLPVGIFPAISALVPEVIYIPAVKNLNDDMKTTQSTSFGRLMSLMLEDMTDDLGPITQALNQLSVLFNRPTDGVSPDARHEKVRSLEDSVQRLLRENFPAVKVELEIPPPDLKTILGTALIYIDDGSRDLIENKGDGIKRTLTFCLLQAYVERSLGAEALDPEQAGPAERPLLFLFEEPELYLHPKSQRVLFNTLARIADKHQVVVSTHSPLFFSPGVTAEFVRVAKQAGQPKPVAQLYPVAVDLGSPHSGIFQLAKFENVDAAFFSRRVVLFEGESDDFHCAKVARLLNEAWNFDASNIALVRVSGKGNFAKYRAFFDAFGIEVKIVADLDILFDGFQHLNAGQPAQQLRDVALQAIDERIAALDIRAEPTAEQIRSRQRSQSLKQKWTGARNALRDIQAGASANAGHLEALDALFTWEADISRLKACMEDAQAAQALVPLLDELRRQGICVLIQGAIEDYYPENAARTGSKPECALRAADMLTHRDHCIALSRPLAENRPSELEEVFSELFREA
jgi:energy-coupling factor transporter ATP-binding protein EcfA2